MRLGRGWLVLLLMALLFATLGGAGARADADSRTAIPEYRLGSGDKIRVITFGDTSLSGEFTISGSGKLAFPLVGDLPAAGLSVPELQQKITAALADGYINNPRVSVEVLTYRPFYILGEVNKPGEYPYTAGLTVLNAVATANGFTYRANLRQVFIKRANSTQEEGFPLTSDTKVAPGDTVRIAPRYF